MTAAMQALETLRLTCQECAVENRAEALDFGSGDDETRAQAVGASGAYAALEKIIAKMQAQGFDDPDPVAELTAQTADMRAQLDQEQRSRRLRESAARLRDQYHALSDAVTVILPEFTMAQLVTANPLFGLIVHSNDVLACIVAEWTPEQQAATEEAFKRLDEFLESLKMGFQAGRGNNVVQ